MRYAIAFIIGVWTGVMVSSLAVVAGKDRRKTDADGKWIDLGNMVECSECGLTITKRSRRCYCPNCGARMGGNK